MTADVTDRLVRRLNGGTEMGRRSFLIRFTTAAAALFVAPLDFILRPGTAYAAICGPSPGCNLSGGYTAFCCTINRGLNRCPPGHFVGGWWKSAGSSYCCVNGQPSDRYILDCHARCTCSGSGNFCGEGCRPCTCRCSNSETCDQRKVCCANFRYGQCNTDIPQSGPVTCRVATCVPPYQLFASCGTTVLNANDTTNHTAPCLEPACA